MSAGRPPLPATATGRVRDQLEGPVVEGRVIGSFPTACYVEPTTGPVVAVLARDAVRLPCGLVVAQPSARLRLDLVSGPVRIGSGVVAVGELSVRVARIRSATVGQGLLPAPGAVSAAADLIASHGFAEHPPEALAALAGYVDAPDLAGRTVAALLGGGTGLTPSGDDVLAGFLVGAVAFGVDHRLLAQEVAASASRGRTTPLSATLLECAAYGEAVPQVTALVSALCSPAWSASAVVEATSSVVSIGHTSGVALATGVVAAARARLA